MFSAIIFTAGLLIGAVLGVIVILWAAMNIPIRRH